MSDEVEAGEMSFGDHLEELRKRLIRAILTTLLAFVVVFNWHEPVLRFVVAPFTDIARDLHLSAVLINQDPSGSFFAYMKVSLIVAMLISAPIWMWQLWAFIGAGLYNHEKKVVYRFVPPMLLLFVAGAAFGYSVLIPIGLRYLLSFADPDTIQNLIGLSDYLSLFTTMTLVLGLVFELPIVMAMLAKIGLVRSQTFREKRRYFILIAFIVGAILTPPDAVTQILMATPLCLLFELGIVIAWAMESDRSPIDWRSWRRRGALLVVIVGVLVYFQGDLADSYRGRLVGQRIRRIADQEGEGLPYFKLFSAMPQVLGFEPDVLFQVQVAKGRELLVVGQKERSALVRLEYRDDRVTKTDESAAKASFLVNSLAHSVAIERLDEMPGAQFMGLLILAIEQADGDDLAVLSAMATGLLGAAPTDVRPILPDDADSVRDAVREAWRVWWEANADRWTYRQEKAR